MAWIGWLLPDERAARLVAEALRHDPSLLVLDEALTMIDEAGGSPALMTALLDRLASDPEPGARALIAEALGAVRDPRAEAALRAAASGDPSHLVRDEARDALEEAAELRGDR
jgi:HEAT repeat protein